EGFTRALYVTHAGDGTDRLFMVQQNGIIYVMENGTLLPTPFLDASGLISSDALGSGYTERGLLGLAFHPDYATNGQFFINYTELSSNDTIVARFTASGSDPNVANPESGDIIFRTAQPYANHNGGHIDFGPDGFLYISVGDGGSAGDPLNSGQQPDTLLGTLLRIDVDSGLPYAIPESNPFVGSTFGAEEVWAYGLRNVWRFSFDRTTGDMYMGDVGQNRWEEVNYQPAGQGGQNYGWNIMEGTNPFSGAAIPADLTGPIAEYQHINGNCSVTGGYVYRGEAIPTLQGAYIYGDYCSGQVWAAYRDASGVWQSDLLIDTDFTISSFGEDESGELYMIHYGSSRIPAQVLRFAPVE
ncbi:MAG: PQQ-dependent sugar dehydrogenase, partial [Chloroflexota bacterium]